MFRFVSYKKTLIAVISIVLTVILCANVAQKSPTKSEILSFFIKKVLGKDNPDGNYVFVCGNGCNGCVQNILLQIDSISDKNKKIIEEWTFVSSKSYTKNMQFKNIKFLYNEEWENVNYDFQNVTLIKIKNKDIVSSKILNAINLKNNDIEKYFN